MNYFVPAVLAVIAGLAAALLLLTFLALFLYALVQPVQADVGDILALPKGTLAQCLTMLAVDYGQTRNIRKNSHLKESNPIMGSYPSATVVRAYFAGLAVAYTAINTYTRPKTAEVVNIFCVSQHGAAAMNNFGLGVGWSF